ncbi:MULTISPECIES: glutamate--tRNA ligase [Oceanotoga]|jgi:glutamyl-tRNA synthetase|uniref:glutamate--tRNA ligase n=1 Tax=Oceanotoga TaxID=1255275 RepID=UPI0026542FC2|nr:MULTISPECIES: glutamate--tRNA ligase [Oceanotoga]MDN5343107.1 nondiscriminating glutamyl-tRNA synthetase [Oceanotoga sp.]MDO7977560.1 glutamate--tRNA ligase [Oceanotoga teriensis]
MIRVRFAPSPTGYLHVGGLRTALFNWYFAKKNNGKFILRIEDTDTERSKKEYEDMILEEMKWAGLDYDEGPDKVGEYGPYRQTERYEIYKKYILKLLEEKKAYYAVYDENQENIIYKSYEYPEKYKDKSITVNFKVPKNQKIKFTDMIKGELEFDSNIFDDFVILRSNGVPVYQFTVVIDDYLMKITHVIRGEDHISNTPKQIMLYNALGVKSPEFGHLSLILGEDKTPLSKRHGGTAVTYFRKEGYLPHALMNYLSVLGWNAENQIYNFKEKIEDFNINDVSPRSAVFDYKKLLWIDEEHLRNEEDEKLYQFFMNWCNYNDIEIKADEKLVIKTISISKSKVSTLKQLFEFIENYFRDNFEYEEIYIKKFVEKEWFKSLMQKSIEIIKKAEDFSVDGAGKTLQKIAEEKITGKKNTFQSIRGALLGKLVTPGLYETIAILGKEEVIKRLERALNIK